MKLGKKLKRLREKSHLSQTEVAENLNISRQAISSWEKDFSTPDIDNLVLLSNLYDFDLNKFLNENVSWKEKISNEFTKYNNSRLKGYLLLILGFITFVIPIGLLVAPVIIIENKKNNTFHKTILVTCIISILYNIFTAWLLLSMMLNWGVTTSITS